jgi:hypothetical protein
MGGGCTESDGRPSLSDSVEELAHRADSRGAARRANDLRAVAEHLRAKEASEVVMDVRPEALARHRRRPAGGSRLRRALRAVGRRVRRLVTR